MFDVRKDVVQVNLQSFFQFCRNQADYDLLITFLYVKLPLCCADGINLKGGGGGH